MTFLQNYVLFGKLCQVREGLSRQVIEGVDVANVAVIAFVPVISVISPITGANSSLYMFKDPIVA